MERIDKVTFKVIFIHLSTATFGSILCLFGVLLVNFDHQTSATRAILFSLFWILVQVICYGWHFYCFIDSNIGELFAGKLRGIECLFSIFKYEFDSVDGLLFFFNVNILSNHVRFFFALHLQAA